MRIPGVGVSFVAVVPILIVAHSTFGIPRTAQPAEKPVYAKSSITRAATRATVDNLKPKTHLYPSIDGAVNPEQIPDSSVYRILFTILASNHKVGTHDRSRSYIRRIEAIVLSGGTCGTNTKLFDDRATDNLLRLAQEFTMADSALRQREIAALKQRRLSELLKSRALRDDLLTHTLERLPYELGPVNSEALREYVSTYMKQHTKLILQD